MNIKSIILLIFFLFLAITIASGEEKDYWSSPKLRLEKKGISLKDYPEIIDRKSLEKFLNIIIKDRELMKKCVYEKQTETITREELCKIFYKLFLDDQYIDDEMVRKTLLNYKDNQEISTDCFIPVALCINYGWLPLSKDNNINPEGNVSLTDLINMVSWSCYPVITIAEINDYQGYIIPKTYSWLEGKKVGGAAYIAGYHKKISSQNPSYTIFLDGGDAISPSPYGNLTRGRCPLDMLNAMGIEALTAGNHEFDYGIERLKKLIIEARFPILGANVVYKATKKRPDWLKPYVILNKGHIKAGILGLVQENTPVTTSPEKVESLEFRSIIETAGEFLPELNEISNINIVLASVPAFPENPDGTGKVKGPLEGIDKKGKIDAIVTGDNHIRVCGNIEGIPVVQAENRGMAMGVIRLEYDFQNKKVINNSVEEFKTYIDNVTPVPEVQKIVDHYIVQTDAILKEQIGYTDTGFDTSLFTECNTGNLITDIIKEVTVSDIAFYNSGGIRQEFMAGPVTIGDIFEMNPFDSYIVTIELTGKQIKDIMERASIIEGEIDITGKTSKSGLQISGMKVVLDRTKPVGNRVISLTLSDGTPIDMEKYYLTGTVSFLTDGGDGYNQFKEGKNLKNTFLIFRNTMMEWVKKETTKGNKINREIEGRIIIKGEK